MLKLITLAGAVLCCAGFCLTSNGPLWWVPAALVGAGSVTIYISLKVNERIKSKRKIRQSIALKKKIRHLGDGFKQQAADDMDKLYRDLIIKEIWQ